MDLARGLREAAGTATRCCTGTVRKATLLAQRE